MFAFCTSAAAWIVSKSQQQLTESLHGHELSVFFFAHSLFVCSNGWRIMHGKKVWLSRLYIFFHPYWLGLSTKKCHMKITKNSSEQWVERKQGDTMNDDDLCSCNFKNKFYPLLPISSLFFHALSIVSWRWCVVSQRVCCRVYAKCERARSGKTTTKSWKRQKSLSTSCNVVVAPVVFLHFPYHDWKFEFYERRKKVTQRVVEWDEEWANLCDVTHSDDEFSKVSCGLCKQSLWIFTICHEYSESARVKRDEKSNSIGAEGGERMGKEKMEKMNSISNEFNLLPISPCLLCRGMVANFSNWTGEKLV